MTHLGALVTPFADGELDAARAASARAHLVSCEQCRRALAQERAARRRTQDSVRGVQASAELTARLLAMPAVGAPATAFGVAPRPRRAPFVLGGGVALVGMFVLSLFVIGSPGAAQTPSALLAAAAADDERPSTASAVSARLTAAPEEVSSGWPVPGSHAVTSLAMLDDGRTTTLDVTVLGDDGAVRLLEQAGRLDRAAAADLTTAVVGGREVYVVDGWYLLEAGPCVVAVLGEDHAAAAAVIADLPEPDGVGVLDRVVAGWQVLVGQG